MSDTATYVYESLCAAFYQMPFGEFLGEQDTEDGRVGWFHLGERPKDLRVSITKPEDGERVTVRAEWRNYSGPEVLKCEQSFVLATYAQRAEDLVPATRDAVLKVLNILHDVLSEEGVAGDISLLAPEAEETEDEE